MTIPILIAAILLAVPAASHADQIFLLTGLGNLFPVEYPQDALLPNGTVSLPPHLVREYPDGFFLVGDPHNAEIVSFPSVYRIPGAPIPHWIYGMVGGSPTISQVPNHGTYWYHNGHISLSTNGLDHTLTGPMAGRFFGGSPAYWQSSGYSTFHGNGTAAYSMSGVSHGGSPVEHFLVQKMCYEAPCGSVTVSRSHGSLLTFPGNLSEAPLYDTTLLGDDPVIVSQDHYIISDTTGGNVRLKATKYDYSRFEVRNVPPGTAYVITGVPYGGPGNPESWRDDTSRDCCHTPHRTILALRAGLLVSPGVISYSNETLGPGPRVSFAAYGDTLWHRGGLHGAWLLFDHHNGRVLKLPGSPPQLVVPGVYLSVPVSADTIFRDVAVAGGACGSPPRKTLGYLGGAVPAGGSVMVPTIPGYPTVCLVADGAPATLRYSHMIEETQTLSFRPDSHNRTWSGTPRQVPCPACGHDILYSEPRVLAHSHVSTVAARDGTAILDVAGFVGYSLAHTRIWDSVWQGTDPDRWSPKVTIQDGVLATVSAYRNGVLAASRDMPCDHVSDSRVSYDATPVGSTYTYHWSWTYSRSCSGDVAVRLDVQVDAGDIIDVVVRAAPRIRVVSGALDGTGFADTATSSAYLGGTLLKSYR